MQVGLKFKSKDKDGNDKATGALLFLFPEASVSTPLAEGEEELASPPKILSKGASF